MTQHSLCIYIQPLPSLPTFESNKTANNFDYRLVEKSLDKVAMYYDISHGEAEVYVFCVLGITDMIQKTMCNNKCKFLTGR